MGRIKSALEIALEKTETVKGDKSTIGQFDAKQRGKKLANAFLSGEIASLESEIHQADRETRAFLRQGMFDALIAQVALPVTENDQKRIEAAGKGLEAVIAGSRRCSVSFSRSLPATPAKYGILTNQSAYSMNPGSARKRKNFPAAWGRR